MSDQLKKSAENLVKAWESLPGDKNYSPKDISKWLVDKMKPAVDSLRSAIKSAEVLSDDRKRLIDYGAMSGRAGFSSNILADNFKRADKLWKKLEELVGDGKYAGINFSTVYLSPKLYDEYGLTRMVIFDSTIDILRGSNPDKHYILDKSKFSTEVGAELVVKLAIMKDQNAIKEFELV